MWEEIKEFMNKDWTSCEKLTIGLICLLAGIIVGLISAPKKHIYIGESCDYDEF